MLMPTVETSRIESRCAKMTLTLDRAMTDDITLLRTARALKSIHGDLRHGLWACISEHGPSGATAALESSLVAMERYLRCVLLEYPSQKPQEMRRCVRGAVDQAQRAVEILHAVRDSADG